LEENLVYANKNELTTFRLTGGLTNMNLSVGEIHHDLFDYLVFMQESVKTFTDKIGNYAEKGKIDLNDFQFHEIDQFSQKHHGFMGKLKKIGAYSHIPTSELATSLSDIKISDRF
jgi:hypothetical protein